MASLPKVLLTPEEYLALEESSPFRSEYLDGQVYAMAGGSKNHARIIRNISGILYNQLRHGPCEAFTSDMRVGAGSRMYTYPDVVIACESGRVIHQETDTLLDPVAVIEVLSPSTQAQDRGLKFERYRAIESLKEYLLVAQEEVLVEHFVRQPDGNWSRSIADKLEESVVLVSVGATLKLTEIYERVFHPQRGSGS
jgi:Uma2 family endonuclease